MLDLYRKALAAIFGAVGVVALAALTDNRITTDEGWAIGIAGGNAVLVYLVPNIPGSAGTALKFAVSVATALAAAIAMYLGDGLTTSELALVVVAGLTAAGVYVVPNDNAFAITGEVLETRQ
jgi:hypothetical protein